MRNDIPSIINLIDAMEISGRYPENHSVLGFLWDIKFADSNCVVFRSVSIPY